MHSCWYNYYMISSGTVHKLPTDLKKAVSSNAKILATWQNITPLARNEFICWVVSAKQAATRARRITVTLDKLSRGERRPCCWAGCPHREHSGK